ncbi:hypothetical protein AAE478_002734 [Parahypoxylon ruwenzoriense]
MAKRKPTGKEEAGWATRAILIFAGDDSSLAWADGMVTFSKDLHWARSRFTDDDSGVADGGRLESHSPLAIRQQPTTIDLGTGDVVSTPPTGNL